MAQVQVCRELVPTAQYQYHDNQGHTILNTDLIEETVEINVEDPSISFFEQDVFSVSIPKPELLVSKAQHV